MKPLVAIFTVLLLVQCSDVNEFEDFEARLGNHSSELEQFDFDLNAVFTETYQILSTHEFHEVTRSGITIDKKRLFSEAIVGPISKVLDYGSEEIISSLESIGINEQNMLTFVQADLLNEVDKEIIEEIKRNSNNSLSDSDLFHLLNKTFHGKVDSGRIASILTISRAIDSALDLDYNWQSVVFENYRRSSCSGEDLVDTAVSAAIVGCGGGLLLGGPGGCLGTGVISATGATLLWAIKCAYDKATSS